MQGVLGPRILHYTREDGGVGDIEITIEIGQRETIGVPGDSFEQHVAVVRRRSEYFEREIRLKGDDDLIAIFRCMWMSDIWLQKRCRDEGVDLYKWIAGDVKADFDVYK